VNAWEGRDRSVGCGLWLVLFGVGRAGVCRSGGGVCEVVRKLCEFVEDEWELVRHMWAFPDTLPCAV